MISVVFVAVGFLVWKIYQLLLEIPFFGSINDHQTKNIPWHVQERNQMTLLLFFFLYLSVCVNTNKETTITIYLGAGERKANYVLSLLIYGSVCVCMFSSQEEEKVLTC